MLGNFGIDIHMNILFNNLNLIILIIILEIIIICGIIIVRPC